MPISGKGMRCIIATPLQSNHRRRYLDGKDLKRLEEVVVVPNQLVAGGQLNILDVPPLREDAQVVVNLSSGNLT
jgi:hypothetical protein